MVTDENMLWFDFLVSYQTRIFYIDHQYNYSAHVFRQEIMDKMSNSQLPRSRLSGKCTYTKDAIHNKAYWVTVGYDKLRLYGRLTVPIDPDNKVESLLQQTRLVIQSLGHEVLCQHLVESVFPDMNLALDPGHLVLTWESLSSYMDDNEISEFTEKINALLVEKTRRKTLVYSRGTIRRAEGTGTGFKTVVAGEALYVEEGPLPVGTDGWADNLLDLYDLYYILVDLFQRYQSISEKLKKWATVRWRLAPPADLKREILRLENDIEETEKRAKMVAERNRELRNPEVKDWSKLPSSPKGPPIVRTIPEEAYVRTSREADWILSRVAAGNLIGFSIGTLRNEFRIEESIRAGTRRNVEIALTIVAPILLLIVAGNLGQDILSLGGIANVLQITSYLVLVFLLIIVSRRD